MKSVFETRKTLLAGVSVWILWQAGNEFHQIAWGTGVWLGEFSPTWGILFIGFVVVSVLLWIGVVSLLFNEHAASSITRWVIRIRKKLGVLRWVLWLGISLSPLYFFQFTLWGIVFQKEYIRILIWILVVCILTVLSSSGERLAGWRPFLAALMLTASLFSVAISLRLVNDYPFSQGWSEGNRLWDYSIIFGRERYDYPPEKDIPVFLDFGRQFIGALPFLIPNLTIDMARLWVGLIQVIPYILLGAVLFRFEAGNKELWLLLILWTFLFLKQGPIHPPLVISAVMVALAWRSPLWIAVPMILGAGYFAQVSRFTWMFAPGMWIFMLEITSASFQERKMVAPFFKRAILLAFFGFLGGVFLANMISSSQALLQQPTVSPEVISTPAAVIETEELEETQNSYPPIIQYVINSTASQPLLWYRLLPNSTYGNGILLALLYAAGPVTILLLYVTGKHIWKLNALQRLSLLLPLLAFLVVGLIVSTKIGGGGDLHNMDMFLIGLLFVSAAAWGNGGREWVLDENKIPDLLKAVIVFSIINSSIGPLQVIRSFEYGEDIDRINILRDMPRGETVEMLPVQQVVDDALLTIQTEVDIASIQGEILFLDQRQLLTFGYITGVKLVPEYEKKHLMNEALGDKKNYFETFHADLAAHRFSLIISEPLRSPVKDSSYQFGEENNAWVKWVSIPVLCYYEPKIALTEVGVQLLVPRVEPVDCSNQLP
ncbi:MAG: hypothetical protein FJ031_07155 [Chloroflexi bacterium]|nr:hypothetical protein [Chloroflexota bacterium]